MRYALTFYFRHKQRTLGTFRLSEIEGKFCKCVVTSLKFRSRYTAKNTRIECCSVWHSTRVHVGVISDFPIKHQTAKLVVNVKALNT